MKWIENSIDKLVIKSNGEIKSRIHELCFDLEISDSKAKGHCYCVKLDGQGNPRTNDLIEFVTNKIVDYALPKQEIDQARELFINTGSTSKIIELKKKAVELFTDLEKTGEGGEILLYALTQEFLGYPQIISKMSLKTSGKLHYQGADGIHVGYDKHNDSLSLYWGESKMYKDLKDGLSACLKSINGFLIDSYGHSSTQERDLQLITSNIKNNINDDDLERMLVRYFDKDDDLSNKLIYKGICFIGFDSENYPLGPKQKTLEDLISAFNTEHTDWLAEVSKTIKKHTSLDLFEIHFFLIPFPSVEKFREHFLATLKK